VSGVARDLRARALRIIRRGMKCYAIIGLALAVAVRGIRTRPDGVGCRGARPVAED